MILLQTLWWAPGSWIPEDLHIDESKAKPPSHHHVHVASSKPVHPRLPLWHSLSQESCGQHLWKHRSRITTEALQKLWRQESRGESQDHFCYRSRSGGENPSPDGPEEENERQALPVSETAEIFHQSSLRATEWIRTLSTDGHLKTKWVCETLTDAAFCGCAASFSAVLQASLQSGLGGWEGTQQTGGKDPDQFHTLCDYSGEQNAFGKNLKTLPAGKDRCW